MKICDVIDNVNKLYPNVYEGNLIRWCYDLSCRIRSTIKRTYDSYDFEIENGQEHVILPNNVHFEDIDTVFADSRPLKKTDWRDVGLMRRASDKGIFDRFTVPKNTKHIRIVVRTRPTEYNGYEIDLLNPVFTDSKITFDNPEDVSLKPVKTINLSESTIIEGAEYSAAGNGLFYIPGDEIVINRSKYAENNKTVVLMEKADNVLTFPQNSFIAGSGDEKITVKRKLNDLTEVPAPWDEAYIFYLLSQIHFHNGSYEQYNANILECEKRLDEYSKYYKETNVYVNKQHFNYY